MVRRTICHGITRKKHGKKTQSSVPYYWRFISLYGAKNLRRKNPGTYVARLASTFFRVFRFFRGSNSSPDWVAGDASARYFVVLKTRKKTTKCTKGTKMEFEDLSTREVFFPLISSCSS